MFVLSLVGIFQYQTWADVSRSNGFMLVLPHRNSYCPPYNSISHLPTNLYQARILY